MGCRSKLTPELTVAILEHLRKGVPDVHACVAVGINQSTFYSWLRDGEKAKSGRKKAFYHDVTRARAEAITTATDCLHSGMMPSKTKSVAKDTITETRMGKDGKTYQYTKTTIKEHVTEAPGDWRAGVEYLKRRDNAHWGDQTKLEHTGTGEDGAIKVEVTYVTKQIPDHEADK